MFMGIRDIVIYARVSVNVRRGVGGCYQVQARCRSGVGAV